jgi:hypothetical protein
MKKLLCALFLLWGVSIQAQQLWLERSDGKIISSFDSVVDRSFFDNKAITAKGLYLFPPDGKFCMFAFLDSVPMPNFYTEFSSYTIGNGLKYSMDKLDENTSIMIGVVAQKTDSGFGYYQMLKFKLKGELTVNPKEKEPEKIENKVWLKNSKGKTVHTTDTVVSKKFFEAEKVDLLASDGFGVNPDVLLLYKAEDGEWQSMMSGDTNINSVLLETIRQQSAGAKMYIVFQNKSQKGELIYQRNFEFVLVD